MVPKSRINGALSLLPLYAFMEWTGTTLLCTMILLKRARSAVVKTGEHTFALLHRLGLKNAESHTESSINL
jgi:UDP-3-O-acyl-N-acetylglucosamine deacetylase